MASISVSDPYLKVRPAENADLTCIAACARAGMPNDPTWDFQFPFRHQFGEDHENWTKKEYSVILKQKSKFYTEVVVAADNEGGADVPVAFAIWDINPVVEATPNDTGIPNDPDMTPRRRDANPTNFRAFRSAMKTGYQAFFEHRQDQQHHLYMLCTHPLFRERGAATLLLQSGLARAAQRRLPVTTFSSFQAYQLLTDLQFHFNGGFVVRAPGEEAHLRVGAFTHHGNAKPPFARYRGPNGCQTDAMDTSEDGHRPNGHARLSNGAHGTKEDQEMGDSVTPHRAWIDPDVDDRIMALKIDIELDL